MTERQHPMSESAPHSSHTSAEESWIWLAYQRHREFWTWHVVPEPSYSLRLNGLVHVASSWEWIAPAPWWTALAARSGTEASRTPLLPIWMPSPWRFLQTYSMLSCAVLLQTPCQS